MIAPQVTTTAEMILNLDSSAPVIEDGWDIDDPNGTSNFSTPITIYDTLGQAHVIQVYFTNISTIPAAPNHWEWHAIIATSDTDVGGDDPYQLFGKGETPTASLLEFDENGLLESPTAAIDFYVDATDLTFANGVEATEISIDFTGTTQYGSLSAIQNINQDGYAPGSASAIGIDDQGNLTASYTNGQVKKIARLGLANFPNINGLSRRGGTLYSETVGSGSPLTNKPGVGGMGTISSSMLEESNVDLAGEIIKMIIIQRGYEANSKVISTTDAMMNTLINIR
jgi:flagellar hook protein FlgE